VNTKNKTTLTNYSMASGRIGLGLVFVPILLAVTYLYVTDQQASKLVALALICLCVPFVWFAVTVPISVRIDVGVSVRYLLWRRNYSRGEVTDIRYSDITTQFGPGILIPGWEAGYRRYRVAIIDLSTRKSIRLKVNEEQVQILNDWFQKLVA